jgi:hypothetical protein
VPSDTVSNALEELATARSNVKKANRQVRGVEDRAALRATALAWFHSHRPALLADAEPELLARVDDAYKIILSGADRETVKQTYLDAIAEAKAALIELRLHLVIVNTTADAPPDFSALTTDADMLQILERRWIECTKCVSVKAHLAAIVMMGGLLEALFVARAKQLSDKSILFGAASVPKNPKTGVPVPLQEWMLNSYLQVGHDVKWITKSARDLAAVLGEYRNYVHPEKEHRHGVALGQEDSAMLWGVTKSLAAQLLASVNSGSAAR